MLTVFAVWIIGSVLAGWFADTRGRCGPCYAVLALVLSPLVAFLILFVVGPNEEKMEERKLEDSGTKRCPYCAELVKEAAIVCKHCGRDLAATKEAQITEEQIAALTRKRSA